MFIFYFNLNHDNEIGNISLKNKRNKIINRFKYKIYYL